MGNRSSLQSEEEGGEAKPAALSSSSRLRGRSDGGVEGEEHDELEVEVPPPMRPISSMPASEDTLKVQCCS